MPNLFLSPSKLQLLSLLLDIALPTLIYWSGFSLRLSPSTVVLPSKWQLMLSPLSSSFLKLPSFWALSLLPLTLKSVLTTSKLWITYSAVMPVKSLKLNSCVGFAISNYWTMSKMCTSQTLSKTLFPNPLKVLSSTSLPLSKPSAVPWTPPTERLPTSLLPSSKPLDLMLKSKPISICWRRTLFNNNNSNKLLLLIITTTTTESRMVVHPFRYPISDLCYYSVYSFDWKLNSKKNNYTQ